MKAKLNFRSVVMKRTWIIFRQTGCSFSEALKAAWQRYRNFKANTVEELTKKIEKFDFHYQMCDDGRVYRYWSAIKKEIRTQIETLPNSFISAIAAHLSNSQEIRTFI